MHTTVAAVGGGSALLLKEAQSKALLILQDKLVSATNHNRQQLADAAQAFQQRLADAEVSTAAEIELLRDGLATQLQKRRHLLVLNSCMSSWRLWCRQHAQQAHHRYSKRLALQAWHSAVCSSRDTKMARQAAAFQGWVVQTRSEAARVRLIQRHQRRPLRHMLLAWCEHSTAQHLHAQQWLSRADRWHGRRVLHQSFSSWLSAWRHEQQLVHIFHTAQQEVLLGRALQAWQSLAQQQTASEHQQQAAAAQSRRRLQQAWKVWQQHACARLQTVCRHRQHRLKHVALCSWSALPAVNLRLRAIAAAVSSSYTRLLLQWGFRAFYSCCSDAVAVRRSARECLKAWCRAAAGSARQRRLLGARAHARRHAVLQAVMRCWAQAAWRSVHQAAACKMLALEAALSLSDAQLQFRQTEVHALQSHQQELARLVATASNAAAPDLPLAPSLQWHCMDVADSMQHTLQPRARHAAFALPALQPVPPLQLVQHHLQSMLPHTQGGASTRPPSADAGTSHHQSHTAAAGCPSDLLGCLVVFGGVAAGGAWLTDVTLLVVNGSPSTAGCGLQAVSVQTAPAQAEQTAAGRTTAGILPLPVCDFAACECGPAAFVVAGGFDGQQEAQHSGLPLQRCTLKHIAPRNSPQHGSGGVATGHQHSRTDSTECLPASQPDADSCQCVQSAPAPASSASGAAPGLQSDRSNQQPASSLDWAQQWQCTWELVQPRTRTPAGRCHHSCCWHAESHSLVVFGGYAINSRQGCLSDVHVFQMQHLEWWQPSCSGGPSPRRSHAAVILNSSLWVQGGLDSHGQHLADLWRLDLTTWEWEAVWKAPVAVNGSYAGPAARRAHSLSALQGRFLLLHGGYDGTSTLLQDSWVFDTSRGCWLAVDVTGSPGQQSTERALHTVTYMAHRLFVVGGQGSFGPVGQVGMLCSPAVLHAQQLHQTSLQQQVQLLQLRQDHLGVREQLQGCAAQTQHDKATLKALTEEAASADHYAAGLVQENAALLKAMRAAETAAAAAASRADAAGALATTLERRLQRARAGGLQALRAAADASARLHTLQGDVLPETCGMQGRHLGNREAL